MSLSWVENGGEFRRVGWSITPEMEPVPLLAAVRPDAVESRLARELSAEHRIPTAPAPPLPGVHRIPH